MGRSTLEHARRRTWFWLLLGLLVVLLAAGGWTWWYLQSRPPQVQAVSVKLRTMKNQVFASGTVKPTERQIVMQGSIPGPVQSIAVSVGQSVRKGQLLLTCVHTQESVALSQAEAQAADAAKSYTDALNAYNSAPQAAQAYLKTVLDSAQSALTTANQAVAQAQAALAAQYIHAQISGKVLMVNPDGVDATGATAPYVEVVSDNKQIITAVSEVDAVRMHPGMPVTITSDAYPNTSWHGTITSVAGFATTSSSGTGQVQVTIGHLPANFPIPFDYQVNVQITNETHRNVPSIPYSALVQSGSSYAVFVIQNGHVRRTIVSLGVTSNTAVEVTKGLHAGQLIVNSPPSNLQDGEAVNVS